MGLDVEGRNSPRMLQIVSGERFGQLTAIGEAPRIRRADGIPKRALHVRCDCGNEKVVRLDALTCGRTKSCGCLQLVAAGRGDANRTHGMSATPIYRRWQAMINRCHNPAAKSYQRYGGRGITVCEEWRKSFDAFYAHVGDIPPGKTLDRIDNFRGYEPGNVRWATHSEQALNKRNSRQARGLPPCTRRRAATHAR